MKNKVLTTRIMAMMMVAAMTMSAAPAVYAAERADSETIKEDNQPTEETADASEEDASEGETRNEYPLTTTTYDYDGTRSKPSMKAPEKGRSIAAALRQCWHLDLRTALLQLQVLTTKFRMI
ncbi:MAG: hypothetical protein ACLVBP_16645 [Ruminococcus sp.]